MIFPVNHITITCTADRADLDQIVQYWYRFARNELRFGDDFAGSSIESQGDKITIDVRSPVYISLYVFDDLSKQFTHLTFKLVARKWHSSTDCHILVYQNGIKTIHINKYNHTETLSQNIEKEITYISDHINRIARVKKEIIKYKEEYNTREFIIVYDKLITNYVQREEEYID